MKKNRFYVYVLLDSSKKENFNYNGFKFKFEPFYVGKGCGNRIFTTLKDKSKYKRNKIKSLHKKGVKIIKVKYKENLTNSEAIDLERKMIKSIGRKDLKEGVLYNKTDGGDGGRLNSPNSPESIEKMRQKILSLKLKWKHKPETIKKMSENQTGKNNNFYGRKRTDKWKVEHSKKVSGMNHHMFGKKHSDNIKNKIKEKSNKGKNEIFWMKHLENSKNQEKEVLQYDLKGNFINSFSSVKKASKETGFSESKISKCCRNETKNPKPFIWRYKNSNILNNSFKWKIGDNYNNMILVKRTKKVCILKNKENKYIQIHIRNNSELWKKKTILR